LVELSIAKWIVESVRKSFIGTVVAKQTVEEKRKVLWVQICKRYTYNRALSGSSVCISELDSLEALWCWWRRRNLFACSYSRCSLLPL
jgi:hypothetical protein